MSLYKTQKPSRATFGDDGALGKKGIVSAAFVAQDLRRPIAADDDVVLADTAIAAGGQTISTGFTNPDVPRNLTVTVGGTAGDISAGNITVTGHNVEGKVITEDFETTADTAETITGQLAFADVTSVEVPAQDGAGVTVSVGVGDALGIGLRNLSSSDARVYINDGGTESLEVPASTNYSSSLVEENTVTTTTALNGDRYFRIYVFNYNWHLNPTNDNPNYGV